MKTIRILKYSFLCILLTSLFSMCKEEIAIKPVSMGEKPGPVTEIKIEAIAGGVEIEFKSPNSKDFLYTKAVYETKPGDIRTVKTSLYINKLTLKGFVKEGKYPVKLYAVSKGEVESDSVQIEVSVLSPSYLSVYNDLEIFDDFGGLTVAYKNWGKDEISINVLKYDPVVKRLVTAHTHFTNDLEGNFRMAGYEPKPLELLFYVSDRWGNNSDTLKKTINPLEEFLMNKKIFVSHPLPPDNNAFQDSYTQFKSLWDDRIGNFYYGTTGYMAPYGAVPGFSFCINIGVKAKLSRFKMHHPSSPANNYFHDFANYTPRLFELWGSNDPNPDGSWESWDKISDFVSTKPAGMSTLELRNYATVQGEDFFVPFEAGAYQYYRWRTTANWGGHTWLAIDELTFWGQQMN